jgi:uncharacterized surface protein with fasciclin (FAS1) repeats
VVVATSVEGQGSLEDIIAADPNLTILQAALTTANVNISDTFSDPITLFAPTNGGFAIYSELLTTYTDVQYIAHLQNVLLMHIVAGTLLSTDLMNGQSITTTNGESITVNITEDTANLSTMNDDSTANIIAVDTLTSDGSNDVLHQIDSVLLPSFINTNLLDVTTNVEGFTILLELLQFTGLAALFSPDLTATVFAPSDAAFMALPEGVLDYYRGNIGVATNLLSGHVLSPLILPTQNMVNGDLATLTPAGTTLTITIVDVEGQTIYQINNATITQENVLANNGIIHVLDLVLEVPGTEYPPLATSPTVLSTTSAPTTTTTTTVPSPTITVVPAPVILEPPSEDNSSPTSTPIPTSTSVPSSVSMGVQPTKTPKKDNNATSKQGMGKNEKGGMMMGKDKSDDSGGSSKAKVSNPKTETDDEDDDMPSKKQVKDPKDNKIKGKKMDETKMTKIKADNNNNNNYTKGNDGGNGKLKDKQEIIVKKMKKNNQ